MPKQWFKGTANGDIFYSISGGERIHYSLTNQSDDPPSGRDILSALQDGKRVLEDTDSRIMVEYKSSTKDLDKSALPSGAYIHKTESFKLPERLVAISTRSEPSTQRQITKDIIKEIKDFVKSEDIYRKVGIQFRRGILMYGPPGEGKTTTIRQIIKKYKNESIIIFLNDIPSAPMLKAINDMEGDRLKIVIVEELATMIDSFDTSMDAILDFLDGETSLDKCLILATTNYPHRLPANIAQRHSRFDLLVEVSSPTKEEIQALVEHFTGEWPVNANIELLIGLSTATIKEICLYSMIKNVSINVAAEKIKERIEVTKQKFQEYEEEDN